MGSGIVALSTTEVLKNPGSMHATFTPKSWPLGGDRVAQRAERVLRGRVRRRVRHAVHAAGDRRHVHDGALAALAHRRQHRPGAAERSEQVGGDDRLPGVVGGLLDASLRCRRSRRCSPARRRGPRARAPTDRPTARCASSSTSSWSTSASSPSSPTHLGQVALVRGCACAAYTRSPRRPNASAAW